jgi:hypothetical protein
MAGCTASTFPLQIDRTMSRFQLPCPGCQATISVGIAQAGSSARCPSCGQLVEVPGTRLLRQLPPEAASQGPVSRQTRATGASLAARLILAGLLMLGSSSLIYGTWLAYERWTAPIKFGYTEDEMYKEFYDKAMQEPIIRSWEHWNYLVDAGLGQEPEPLPYFIYSRYYEARKPWMVGSLATGAVLLAAFLGLSFAGFRRIAA